MVPCARCWTPSSEQGGQGLLPVRPPKLMRDSASQQVILIAGQVQPWGEIQKRAPDLWEEPSQGKIFGRSATWTEQHCKSLNEIWGAAEQLCQGIGGKRPQCQVQRDQLSAFTAPASQNGAHEASPRIVPQYLRGNYYRSHSVPQTQCNFSPASAIQ